MTPRALPLGKLPPALLSELLPQPSDAPPELLLAPRIGEDACAIALEAGVLIAATDPITLTGDAVGAHAVLVNANDVAVMGARPRWFLASVLLPQGTTEPDVRALFRGMHEALAHTGATLVGGHTEVTRAVSRPIVVGQMLGHRQDGRFVSTGGLAPGDVLLQIGPAPIEGAAVIAAEVAPTSVSEETIAAARGAILDPGISVVAPALLAAELGATSMHDPTEGGIAAALHEVAEASSLALTVDADAVLWFAPGIELCAAVGADPWGTLASGALLAGFAAERAEEAALALTARGFACAAIAHATEGAGVRFSDGTNLARFDRDELSRVL